MIYKKGSSIKINGIFTCDFKDSKNNIIELKDIQRSFTFLIKGSDIINTNLSYNINDLEKIEDWIKKPINSRDKTKSQIPKLSVQFIEQYITDGVLSKELTNSLKELYDRKIYKGGVIDSYSKLLNSPYEILVKSIFNIEKQKNKNTNHLFPKLFKKHISNKSAFISFESNKVVKGKSGVYFFTFNDRLTYVGKSSNFQNEYNGYKSGRVNNSFPNNNGTRGKINMKIAEKASMKIKSTNIKWYNLPIDNTNIDNIFDNLKKNGVDIKNTFKNINPKLDFFETLIMSKIDEEKWNIDKGGFENLIKI